MNTHISTRPRAIAFFCTAIRLYEDPITDEYFWDAYQDLLLAIKARGIEAYFVTGNDSYLGNGRFKFGRTTDTKVPHPRMLRRVTNIQVDLVFERSEPDPFVGTDVPVLNAKALRDIINNKISIYEHFSEWQPHSEVVLGRDELESAVRAMVGDKVVVKVPDGFGGYGVYIGTKQEVLERTPSTEQRLMVQQFVDTSLGVPGHEPGVHDVRLKICGGEIINYSIRHAAPGSYLSNISQGGVQTYHPITEVPAELRRIVRAIDRRLNFTPRFYSADFVYSEQGWKLIELNDYLGLTAVADGEEAVRSVNRLADYIVKLAVAAHEAKPLVAGIVA